MTAMAICQGIYTNAQRNMYYEYTQGIDTKAQRNIYWDYIQGIYTNAQRSGASVSVIKCGQLAFKIQWTLHSSVPPSPTPHVIRATKGNIPFLNSLGIIQHDIIMGWIITGLSPPSKRELYQSMGL